MIELLASPIYSRWLQKVPRLEPHVSTTPAWRLFVQREEDGKWAVKVFDDYEAGLEVLLRYSTKYYDLALTNRRQEFKAPSVKRNDKRLHMKIPVGHVWCGYCRRPTMFGYFTRHHAFPKRWQGLISGEDRRCVICGTRISFLKHKRVG